VSDRAVGGDTAATSSEPTTGATRPSRTWAIAWAAGDARNASMPSWVSA